MLKFKRLTVLFLTAAFVLSGVFTANRASDAVPQADTTVVAKAVAVEHQADAHGEEKFEPGKVIMEHILDAHDWHLWGEGHGSVSIPLPVIVYSSRGLEMFPSSHFQHGHSTHRGYMLHKKEGEQKFTIVAIKEMEQIDPHTATIDEEVSAGLIDLSITKNVAVIFISGFLLVVIMLSVAKSYTRRKGMAPKGLQSLLEPLIIMIRDDVAKPSIGVKYERFMPYLLSVFFFIFLNNLLGLIPFFPGGANLTGNVSVTITLAAITFVIQLLSANKNFWVHILAMPGVPKPILLILTPIEILGLFLRPFVLLVRLFANIAAGHIVAMSFISMIFIFKESFGTGGAYGISVFSMVMYVFMGFLELLVAFLQAYVFTLLSAIYFGSAVEEHHHEEAHH